MQAVAYSADGRFFVVGGLHGLAIYDATDLTAPPEWVPLDPPAYYEGLTISSDGTHVRLEGWDWRQVRSLADGRMAHEVAGLTWAPSSTLVEGWMDTLHSPDGALRLELSSGGRQDGRYGVFEYQVSVRQMYDARTRVYLYDLTDPTMQVTYEQRNAREGCDLKSFSYCGNAYEPGAMMPYRATFAPDTRSLAIVYRMSYSPAYSVLKVYDTADGSLMQVLGDFDQPVQSFAYAPDGRQLLVGYGDGALTLWDLRTDEMTWGAHHFNGPIYDLAFTPDSDLLLVKSPGVLDVRRTSDGALWQRLAANAFAVSPVDNRVALGQVNGLIEVLDLDTNEFDFSLSGHEDTVFALAFSEDGTLLASAGGDCRVAAWEALGGELQHLYAENETDAYGEGYTRSRIYIKSLAFVQGTNQLVGYGSWARVASWNEDTGATQYLIEPDPLEYYHGMMTLNPHFPGVSGLDLEQQVLVMDGINYDLGTGEAVGVYEPPATLEPGCSPFGAASADGQLRFTLGHDSRAGQVCILDARDLSLRAAIQVMPGGETAPYVWGLELSPDGRQLAVIVEGGLVYIYQTAQR
jgi:WD40 repeat protein